MVKHLCKLKIIFNTLQIAAQLVVNPVNIISNSVTSKYNKYINVNTNSKIVNQLLDILYHYEVT